MHCHGFVWPEEVLLYSWHRVYVQHNDHMGYITTVSEYGSFRCSVFSV